MNNRLLDELSKQVHSLATSFNELSKTVTSALEDTRSNGSGTAHPVYKYSKHLPTLKPTDFELELPYWYRAPWSEIRNGKASVDTEDPILVLFFEDATGDIVPKSEIQSVRNFVKAYFELLWDNRRAPKSWTHAALDLQIDFVRNLEEEYE